MPAWTSQDDHSPQDEHFVRERIQNPSDEAFHAPAAGQMAIQGIGKGGQQEGGQPDPAQNGVGAHGPAAKCRGRQRETSHREGVGDDVPRGQHGG